LLGDDERSAANEHSPEENTGGRTNTSVLRYNQDKVIRERLRAAEAECGAIKLCFILELLHLCFGYFGYQVAIRKLTAGSCTPLRVSRCAKESVQVARFQGALQLLSKGYR